MMNSARGTSRRSWIIWYAVGLHLWWGTAFFLAPPHGADWHGGVMGNIYLNVGGELFWAIVMVAGSIAAAVSLFMKRGKLALMLLLPQQAVLTVGALGIVTAVFDVFHIYETSRIIRVAYPVVGAFGFHTLAILDHYGVLRWKKI